MLFIPVNTWRNSFIWVSTQTSFFVVLCPTHSVHKSLHSYIKLVAQRQLNFLKKEDCKTFPAPCSWETPFQLASILPAHTNKPIKYYLYMLAVIPHRFTVLIFNKFLYFAHQKDHHIFVRVEKVCGWKWRTPELLFCKSLCFRLM